KEGIVPYSCILNVWGGNSPYRHLIRFEIVGRIFMLKIQTIKEDKSFSAFVKSYVVDWEDNLYGLAIVGTHVACRAIYASLYNSSILRIYDSEDTSADTRIVTPSETYTKVEEKDGKMLHLTALPRTASKSGYNNEVKFTTLTTDDSQYPKKVVMSWNKENHDDEVSKHLADKFGLPTKSDWINKYVDILPFDKTQPLEVINSSIGEEFNDVALTVVHEISLNEVLESVETAIHQGMLNPVDKTSDIQANFEEGWGTEDYLRENSQVLVEKIDKHMKPKYSADYLAEEIGEMNRLPVPAQAKSAMGILSVLKDKKGAFLSGQMGSGKTQISVGASYVKARQREKSGANDGMRVLVVAPQNVVPKWMESEVPEILGDVFTIQPHELNLMENQYSKSSNISDRRSYKEYQSKNFLVTLINSTKDA